MLSQSHSCSLVTLYFQPSLGDGSNALVPDTYVGDNDGVLAPGFGSAQPWLS